MRIRVKLHHLLSLLASFAGAGLTSAQTTYHVDGAGFFRLFHNGHAVYSRTLKLQIIDGKLADDSAKFLPEIQFSGSVGNLSVQPDGTVLDRNEGVAIGRLEIAMFPKNELMSMEGTFFVAEDGPTLTYPGIDGAGTITTVGSSQATGAQVHHEPTPPAKSPSTSTSTQTQVHRDPPIKSIASAKVQPTTEKKGATSNSKVEIVIHADSSAPGDNFTLGEVADISGPDDTVAKLGQIQVGTLPPMGTTRIIDLKLLRLRLMGAGFDPDQISIVIPPDSHVQRAGTDVSSEDILGQALTALQSATGTSIPWKPQSPVRSAKVKTGELSMDCSTPQQTSDGYFVNVNIRVDGQLAATRSLVLVPADGSVAAKAGDTVNVEIKAGSASVVVQGKLLSRAFIGQQVTVTVSGVGEKPTNHTGTLVAADKVVVKI